MRSAATRRRFLALAAAATAAPVWAVGAGPVRWRGVALGAPASIEIHGEPGAARAALRDAVAELRRLERALSLYDPGSALSRLNREGAIPPGEGVADIAACLLASWWCHRGSDGRFNPFVQGLWRALAEGRSPGRAERRLEFAFNRDGGGLALRPDAALTFNGIAQGHVADALANLLRRRGFDRVLLDTGEIRASGGPWRVGLEDPGLGPHGWVTLEESAVATSSPGAMVLADGGSHIVVPGGPRRLAWSSVTVEAASARHADACSTTLAMTRDRDDAEETARRLRGIRRLVLVDLAGDVATLRPDAAP